MKIRFLALLMTALMLFSCFVSCAQDKKDPSTGSPENKEETEKNDEDIVKILDSEYTVVRSENADVLTTEAAKEFKDLINEKSSLSLTLKSDYLKEGEKASEKEIIIGKTNRETKFDRSTLKEGQYYVGVEDSRVIIDAYDSKTLYLAISSIVDGWMSLGEGTFTIEESIFQNVSATLDADKLTLKIMSQNVRYKDDGAGKNISERAPRFKELVDMYKPDLIGTQETTAKWNTYFKKYFKDTYGMIGCSRDGKNATSGEWGTILYRLDRFELLDSDDFWLTQTPDKVSRVNGAKCNRICTWALLKDKFTGETFVFANTHLDHSTDEVRLEQLGYLLSNLDEFIGKYPIYITGDFNATPTSQVYKTACNSLADSHVKAFVNNSEIDYTFDSYGTNNPGSRIDYCFYNDRSVALEYKILNEQFDGYVSDHYGIITEFVIK